MNQGTALAKTARVRVPHAVLCLDPFHVVKLATDALENAYGGRRGNRPAATPTSGSPANSRVPVGCF